MKEEYRKYGNHSTNIIHGMCYTHFYSKFTGMYDRCNGKERKYYYQKGIKICDRWKKFENFKNDMYKSYLSHVEKYGEKETTLERKNNNKGYCPENCIWATRFEQNLNKGDNKFIEWNGVKKTYSEWSRELGGNRGLVNTRLKLGWSIKKIMITPVKKLIKKI